MTEFREGQRVHVEFDGTIKLYEDYALVVNGAYEYAAFVPYGCITPLEPESWPPRVGDIWEAEGVEYIVREYDGCEIEVHAVSPSGVRASKDFYENHEMDAFKALNPTLIRRREEV